MKFKSPAAVFGLLFSFLLVAFSMAEIDATKLLKGDFSTSSAPEKTENAVELKEQLQVWKAEAKAALAKLTEIDPKTDLPEGVSPADLSTRIRYLDSIMLSIGRHDGVVESMKNAEEELSAAEAHAKDWEGFDTPPPYSVLMLDQLVNSRAAQQDKIASRKSSLDIFRSTLGALLTEGKEASEATSAAIAVLDKADETSKPAAQWRVDTARLKQRSLFIRASALKYNIAALEKLEKASTIELGLLDRKIETAKRNFVFDEKDLEQIKKASADRQKELRKDSAGIAKRLTKAISERDKISGAVEKMKAADNTDPTALEMIELQLESANTSVDTLQLMLEAFEFYGQLESFLPDAYELRYTLMTSKDPAERKDALENLEALNKRLIAGEVVARNELDSVNADLNSKETRAAALPADDPKLSLLNNQRNTLREKRDLIQRAYTSVTSQRQVLARWVAEFEASDNPRWYKPIVNGVSRAWEAVKRAWNVPVSSYTQITNEGGYEVKNVRYVSLGTVVIAVLLFIVAYFVAARISCKIQKIFVERHYIGENQARTMRNWLMLVVALLLALATMSWLSIPLTVFAFLAGALAIGVGFGTQTIIKNFISGIILLFERKIRVGDIVEVDGTTGVVSEINTRSSIVRGFNGIENLIPNSLLLENRVVNWTLNSRFLRRELELGVAYGTPPQKVITILQEAAERHGLVLKDPAPFAVFKHFGDNSLDFTLYYWIELNDKTNGLVVASDLRIMIEKRLEESSIGVPYPQRDIHIGSREPVQIEVVRQKAKPLEEDAEIKKSPDLP
ncbi:mechanosensitive ion channel domain-containing protein [Luteolibacter algae]|uniref:Mechanosensitive ion channel domain-containing protein n=1 Tax=Luteolibacter algae TaxID=454151 RepID=A0ABW5D265_9BACT